MPTMSHHHRQCRRNCLQHHHKSPHRHRHDCSSLSHHLLRRTQLKTPPLLLKHHRSPRHRGMRSCHHRTVEKRHRSTLGPSKSHHCRETHLRLQQHQKGARRQIHRSH